MAVSCESTRSSSRLTWLALLATSRGGFAPTSNTPTSSTPRNSTFPTDIPMSNTSPTEIPPSCNPPNSTSPTEIPPTHIPDIPMTSLEALRWRQMEFFEEIRTDPHIRLLNENIWRIKSLGCAYDEDKDSYFLEKLNVLVDELTRLTGERIDKKDPDLRKKIAEVGSTDPLQKIVTEALERLKNQLSDIYAPPLASTEAFSMLKENAVCFDTEYTRMMPHLDRFCRGIQSAEKCDGEALILILFWTYATESDENPPPWLLSLLKSCYERDRTRFVWLAGQIRMLLCELHEERRKLLEQTSDVVAQVEGRENEVQRDNPFLLYDLNTLRNHEEWLKWQREGKASAARTDTWACAELACNILTNFEEFRMELSETINQMERKDLLSVPQLILNYLKWRLADRQPDNDELMKAIDEHVTQYCKTPVSHTAEERRKILRKLSLSYNKVEIHEEKQTNSRWRRLFTQVKR